MTGAKRRGRFVADYYVKTGGTLKRRRLSFKTATERDAELERARELERRARGLATDVDRLKTVAAFADEWLAGLVGQIKARTLEAYAKAVTLYIVPRLGERPVVELTRASPYKPCCPGFGARERVETARFAAYLRLDLDG